MSVLIRSGGFMKKFILSLLVTGLFFLNVSQAQAVVRAGNGVVVEGIGAEEIVGPHFLGGERVVIKDTLEGDVYVGGGDVRIDGTIVGDLIVGGGRVTINGQVTDDLRVGGGTVIINGEIGKNVSVGAGSLDFGSESVIGGSVVGGAGTIILDGQIEGNVWFSGGDVEVAGRLGSDVHLAAGQVHVSPDAKVAGQLIIQAEAVEVSSQATLSHEPQITLLEDKESRQAQDAHRMVKELPIVGNFVKLVIGFFMGLVSGVTLLYFFPKQTDQVVKSVVSHPMSNIGWGFVHLVVLPVAVLILVITVIGLPLAGLIGLGYLLSFILASLISPLVVGRWLHGLTDAGWLKSVYMQLVLGLVILKIAGLIPVVGWVIKLMVFLMVLGGLLTAFKRSFSRGQRGKLLPKTRKKK